MAKIIRLTESDLTRIVRRVLKEDTQSTDQILQTIGLSSSDIESAADDITPNNLVIPDEITKGLGGEKGVKDSLSILSVLNEECQKPEPDNNKILSYLDGLITQLKQSKKSSNIEEQIYPYPMTGAGFFLRSAGLIAAGLGVLLLLRAIFKKRGPRVGCPVHNRKRRY